LFAEDIQTKAKSFILFAIFLHWSVSVPSVR